ncbi:MAG: YfiR family protein [Phycisphaerales bacterium]
MTVSHSAVVRAEDAIDREYRIKAAFVYNFLKFVEGGRFAPAPGRKKDEVDPNDPLVIGVLGVPPSRIAFEEFNGRQIGNRVVVVRWFKGFEELAGKDENIPERHPDLDRIKVCHVLFLCPSERVFLPRVLPHLRESGMLTVGDVPLFLENGGTINLLIEERKVRFEINLAAAARAKLEIRSSLLRLAVRTVEHDQLAQQKDEEDPGGAGRP